MPEFEKIRQAMVAREKDKAARAAERYCLFLAGPFVRIDEPPDHKDNSATASKRLRYYLYHELDSAGYNIYLGEDVHLRTIGDDHFGSYNNAVVYERHYILNHVHAVIIIPDSPGSFCEMGDWASDQVICNDMLIIIDQRHQGSKSYINDGVVRFAKSNRAFVEYLPYDEKETVLSASNTFLSGVAERMRIDRLYGRKPRVAI